MSETQKITLIKKGVVVGAYVRADVLYRPIWGSEPPEDYARELDRACREFHDFIKDHRSMDHVTMEVIRETEDQCTACGEKWEPDEYDGDTHCANCGAILQNS